MLESLFWVAVGLALTGAVAEAVFEKCFNVCAWGLLLSAAVTEVVFPSLGVAYNWVVWLLVDVAVLSGIGAVPYLQLCRRDAAVVLLFLPAWALLSSDERWAIDTTTAIVIAQLLITVPWLLLREQLRRIIAGAHHSDNGFSRVAYAYVRS